MLQAKLAEENVSALRAANNRLEKAIAYIEDGVFRQENALHDILNLRQQPSPVDNNHKPTEAPQDFVSALNFRIRQLETLGDRLNQANNHLQQIV